MSAIEGGVAEAVAGEVKTASVGTDTGAHRTTISGAAAAVDNGHEVAEGEEDGGIEKELEEMERDNELLRKEGLITAAEAAANAAQVEGTRKTFRSMSREERSGVIRRRREFGLRLLDKQIAGASIVPMTLRLNHSVMKPLFEQWWPYLNRMSLNMERFGRATFKDEEKALNGVFEKMLSDMENYVGEQRAVAEAFREKTEKEMLARRSMVFNSSVTLPTIERDIEIYTPFAMRLLNVIRAFDETLDHLKWMQWNGVRSSDDVNDEVQRFLRKFQPIGVRGYQAHLKLMFTVHNR